MAKNYYQILEVEQNSSQEAIREQYRFLVQAWHPDKFSNPAQKLKAEEKIKEINEAYEVLRNPAKRADYDRYLNYVQSGGQKSYKEKATSYQSEDKHHNEEAARRAREEQLRREKENRERAEAQKRKDEETKKRLIKQLEHEIMLVNQEISKLSSELPRMPASGPGILFSLTGILILYTAPFSGSLLLYLTGAALLIMGIRLLNRRSRFFKEKYKPKYDEIEKQKQRLAQLILEKHRLE